MITLPDIDAIEPGVSPWPAESLGFLLDERPPPSARPPEARIGRALFDDDFDLPPRSETPEEPEIIEPSFSVAELEAAREEGFRAGRDAEAQSRAASDRAIEQQWLGRVAAALDAAAETAEHVAEDAAEALVRMLLDTFAAVFPAMCERFGEAEAKGLVAAILPVLRLEPRATIRLAPALHQAITDTINRADRDLVGRIDLHPDLAMTEGDIHVTWRNGQASRDTSALWTEIGDILGQAGWPLPRPGTRLPVAAAQPDAAEPGPMAAHPTTPNPTTPHPVMPIAATPAATRPDTPTLGATAPNATIKETADVE